MPRMLLTARGMPWMCRGSRNNTRGAVATPVMPWLFWGSGHGTDALIHGRGPGCARNAVAPPGIPQPCQGPGDHAGDPIYMPGIPYPCRGCCGCFGDLVTVQILLSMAEIPQLCRGSHIHAGDAVAMPGMPVTPWETPTLTLSPCRRAQHRRGRLPGTAALGGGDGGGAGLQCQWQPPAPRRLRQARGPPRPPGQPQRHPRPRRHLPVPSHQRARLGSPQHHHHR